jgi:hypothetical protein
MATVLPSKLEKRLSDAELMAKIDKAKPAVFPKVLAGKIEAGTITARCFNLINRESQRLATLAVTDDERSAGLALFTPGSDRARVELMLTEAGPVLRLNNAQGRQRFVLQLTENETAPTLALLDAKGNPRIMLFLHHDRPHVIIYRRGARQRDVVLGVPFNKQPEHAAWKRMMRAARANQREKFVSAVLDAGFLSYDTDRLWTFLRRRLDKAPTTPEDTLLEAGVSTKRQARYQRRLSSLLAGRA